MHDGMQHDPIQGHGQGHEPYNVGNPAIFKKLSPPYAPERVVLLAICELLGLIDFN